MLKFHGVKNAPNTPNPQNIIIWQSKIRTSSVWENIVYYMSFAWGDATEAQYLLTMHCFYTGIKRAWMAPLQTQNCLCPAERSSDHILQAAPPGEEIPDVHLSLTTNRTEGALPRYVSFFVDLQASSNIKQGLLKSNLIFVTVFLNSKCGNDHHLPRVKQTCSVEHHFAVMTSTDQRQKRIVCWRARQARWHQINLSSIVLREKAISKVLYSPIPLISHEITKL